MVIFPLQQSFSRNKLLVFFLLQVCSSGSEKHLDGRPGSQFLYVLNSCSLRRTKNCDSFGLKNLISTQILCGKNTTIKFCRQFTEFTIFRIKYMYLYRVCSEVVHPNWRKPEYPEKTNVPKRATTMPCHIRKLKVVRGRGGARLTTLIGHPYMYSCVP